MIRKYSPVIVSLFLWGVLASACTVEWHDGLGPGGTPPPLFPGPVETRTPTSTVTATLRPTLTATATGTPTVTATMRPTPTGEKQSGE